MDTASTENEPHLQRLLEIVARLRAPDGCPWDRAQTKADIGRYLIEEAYEVIDAIASGKADALREELGDLLFHILFLAHISEESREFTVTDIMQEIAGKMIRRHPHVFGTTTVRDVGEVKDNWEEIKRHEKKALEGMPGLLDRIPRSMPSLMKAQEMTAKASRVGFDWKKTDDVIQKIEEELAELKAALRAGQQDGIREETGDLLLSIVNLCRFTGLNAEETLQAATRKFAERFAYIEDGLRAMGKTPAEATLEEMDRFWNECKPSR